MYKNITVHTEVVETSAERTPKFANFEKLLNEGFELISNISVTADQTGSNRSGRTEFHYTLTAVIGLRSGDE